MKNYIVSIISLPSFLLMGNLSQAQAPNTAFHKYSLSLAVTGGSTRAEYSTRDNSGSGPSVLKNREGTRGAIDPFILEFGISNHFGVGFTTGGETYNVDANKFYDYRAIDESRKLSSNTHYFTFDFNYHPYVTNRLDVSVFSGIGTLKVNIADYPTQYNSDGTQNMNYSTMCQAPVNSYYAKGAIVRTGIKARYYFWKRLGVMGMVTTFSGIASPRNTGALTFGNNYSTIVTGFATEFGLCFRFF